MASALPSRHGRKATQGCYCGFFGDGSGRCTCDPGRVVRYRARVSGPLMDRIDLHVDVPAVRFGELSRDGNGETSATVRKRVIAACELQRARFEMLLEYRATPIWAPPSCAAMRDRVPTCSRSFSVPSIVLGAYHRLLKVARTIADLEGSKRVVPEHAAEAIQYRSLDRTIRVS